MDWPVLQSEWAAIAALVTLVLLTFVACRIWSARRLERARTAREDAEESARILADENRRLSDDLETAKANMELLSAEAKDQRKIAEDALKDVVERTDRLKQLNEAKSRFMSGISSQLRTPLTLIINPLEEVIERCGHSLESDASDDLDLALRNARRLLLIVSQIQDIAKLDSGQMSVRPMRIDLRGLVEDLSLSFTPWAERKRIRFQLEVPEEKVVVHADPDVLRKALVNLTTASFKVTPPDGAIRVTVNPPKWHRVGDEEDSFVRITIRDTGPGIPPDELPHLFDRFYQVSAGLRTELSAALELPLARELIELLRGKIDVTSEVGFGTEVTVFLKTGGVLQTEQISEPAGGRSTPGELPAESFSEMPGDGGPSDKSLTGPSVDDVTTVLVVEDNDDVRTLLRRILEPGLRVLEAGDGREGLQKVRDFMPDLVISDVMMPGLDGFELCQRIKSDRELSFIPVILLTAKADMEDRIEGLKEGADDYIIKPFNRSELKVRVNNLIAQRRRIKSRFSTELELHASDIEVVSSDENFIRNVRNVIEAHIDDEDFTVEEFADAVGMSRGHLHRRLKSLLRLSPSEAVRKVRLERAHSLLAGGAGTVSEIAYQVGFRSVSHFCRCFKDAYGCTPAESVSHEGPESILNSSKSTL